MLKLNNIVRVPCTLKSFFRYWFIFLRPFHHLTDREIDVASSFIVHRHELSKVIKDTDILDKVTMSEDTKRKIMEECNMNQLHFNNIMSKLRKNKVIVDGKINLKFVPNLTRESGPFLLLYDFEISDSGTK